MFYNPTQIKGVAELCMFGGYYYHELVRTPGGLAQQASARRNGVDRQLPARRSGLSRQLPTGGGDFAAPRVTHRA